MEYGITFSFHAAMLVCAMVSFWIGIRFLKKSRALFSQLVVCGLGCFALMHLFAVVMLFSEGEIPNGFHVGRLALIGGMLFLFTASFGQMDDLTDSSQPEYKKYCWIAGIAPLVILLTLVPTFLAKEQQDGRILTTIQTIFLAQASYFQLKHLIIPDVEMGIVSAIRKYNLSALILEVFLAVELEAQNLNSGYLTKTVEFWNVVGIVGAVGTAASYLAIILTLRNGVRKWTM